jgi:hypothetical protein
MSGPDMLDLAEKSRKGRRVRKETDMTSTVGKLTLASPRSLNYLMDCKKIEIDLVPVYYKV